MRENTSVTIEMAKKSEEMKIMQEILKTYELHNNDIDSDD